MFSTRCRLSCSTISFSAGAAPDSYCGFHCQRNCAWINRQEIPTPWTLVARKRFTTKRCIFWVYDLLPRMAVQNCSQLEQGSSCPALCRASTSLLHSSKKDVDGRDEAR